MIILVRFGSVRFSGPQELVKDVAFTMLCLFWHNLSLLFAFGDLTFLLFPLVPFGIVWVICFLCCLFFPARA